MVLHVESRQANTNTKCEFGQYLRMTSSRLNIETKSIHLFFNFNFFRYPHIWLALQQFLAAAPDLFHICASRRSKNPAKYDNISRSSKKDNAFFPKVSSSFNFLVIICCFSVTIASVHLWRK